MSKTQPPITVADLLLKAKVITQDQLARAVSTSARLHVAIGPALVTDGIISSEIVRTTGLAHTLVIEKLLPEDLAVEAVARCHQQKSNLEEVLEGLGWRIDSRLVTGRLVQILAESQTVSEANLNNAIEASIASGLPLGRVLVVRKVVPESLAYAALTAHVLIKEGKITAQQAIDGIKLAHKESITVEDALTKLGSLPIVRSDPVRLGQLLVSAELINEFDLLSAVERGMSDEMPIGQVLTEQGLIPHAVLERALKLQQQVNNRSITPKEAVLQLKQAVRDGDNNDDSLSRDSGTFETERQSDSARSNQPLPDSVKVFGIYNQDDWFRTVQELTLEKQNLAFKVVSQQEEMKYRLARDLHDTIIADLMMLKRYLGGDRDLSTEDIVEIVDHVVMQLRDICSDFAPRNYKEWGLAMTIKDMMDRMSDRTGIQAVFQCAKDIPELPDPVGLHVYRIIQEALNNVEKYSGATQVTFVFERPKEKLLRFSVSDNGKGFDTEGDERAEELPSDDSRSRARSGGMGMGGMKERADLIRCFFQTKLTVQSSPGSGSAVQIEIELP